MWKDIWDKGKKKENHIVYINRFLYSSLVQEELIIENKIGIKEKWIVHSNELTSLVEIN